MPKSAATLTLLLLGSASAVSVVCEQAGRVVESRHHVNETNVTGVTVFVDRAEITRELQLQLHSTGPLVVVLDGLPESLEAGSIRVESSSKDLSIVDTSELTSSDSSGERQHLLKKELDAIRSELRRLSSKAAQLDFLMSSLEGYTKARLGALMPGSQVVANLDTATETFDFYSARAQHLHDQLAEVNEAQSELSKKESRAQKNLDRLVNSRERAAMVEAYVGSEASCIWPAHPYNVTLEFRYMTRNASWSPSYDVKVLSGEQAVYLAYNGNVLQSTGEDWPQVRLLLSTSDPSRAVSPPRARQRQIHFTQNLREIEGGYGRPGRSRSTKLATITGSVLEIPRAVTVPTMSGGQPRKINIDVYVMNASFAHYATPTVSPHAYLQATINNTSPFPLLPSKTVQIFFDGGFVATSELDGIVGVNASFTSFLGIDYAVKIQTNPEVQRYQSSLLGGDVTTFTSSTHLVNRKAAPLYIKVQGSMVQSMTDKIKMDVISPSFLATSQAEVDPFSLSPGTYVAHLDNQTGAINWGVCLSPHSEITLPLVFTATTSRGRHITVVEGRAIQFDTSSDAHMEL
eukprot:TRINITY_DN37663_c0_g1_i1.p1 TRINITY_DN37663_c0_g1~~TRINITY_DN37663_c0_g1_i1.p1  ORF type:complete len:574 (+),score=86.99 TRINITY_DN37663_c0_g1_i1:78-1799(+)